MMKYIKGDLLSATEGLIIHGCNCQGVMGSGVALALRNKYPEAYYDYLDYCAVHSDTKSAGKNMLGTICYSHVTEKLTIANAFTQQFYGKDGRQYASYAAIEDCFQNIQSNVCPSWKLHLPKIGCGLGGLDWKEVVPYIDYYLGSHDVTVYEL